MKSSNRQIALFCYCLAMRHAEEIIRGQYDEDKQQKELEEALAKIKECDDEII